MAQLMRLNIEGSVLNGYTVTTQDAGGAAGCGARGDTIPDAIANLAAHLKERDKAASRDKARTHMTDSVKAGLYGLERGLATLGLRLRGELRGRLEAVEPALAEMRVDLALPIGGGVPAGHKENAAPPCHPDDILTLDSAIGFIKCALEFWDWRRFPAAQSEAEKLVGRLQKARARMADGLQDRRAAKGEHGPENEDHGKDGG